MVTSTGLKITRRERLKSALYLRLKKRKKFFRKKLEIFEKNLKFSKKNFKENVAQCRKKIKRGDPLASDGFVDYVKKVQNERGDPLETKKLSKKSRTAPKKKSKGGTL